MSKMSFNEYQDLANRTTPKNFDTRELGAMTGLGIAGEAGEVADLVKKWLYHGHTLDVSKLEKELGDVLWYIAILAKTTGLSLEDIAVANIAKLKARYPNGFSEEASRTRKE